MKSTFIKNQFISCLWMFFVCFTCLCQNDKIDSLKKGLFSKKLNVNLEIDLYEKIITLYWSENIDSAIHYTNKLKNFSNENNNFEGLIISDIYDAVNNDIKNNVVESNKIFNNVIKKIPSNNYKLKAIYFYNYGNHLFYKNELTQAIKMYEKATLNYKLINDENTVARIALNIGYIHSLQNNFYKSTLIYQKAIPVFEKNKDWLALSSLYGRIGYNFGNLSMPEKAIEYHQRGITIDRKYNLVQNEAYALSNIAIEYSELKKFKIAEYHYKQSANKFRVLKDQNMLMKCELNIALMKYNEKNYKGAIEDLKRLNINQQDKAHVLSYNHLFGNLMLNTGNLMEAESYFNKAFEVFNEDKGEIKSKEFLFDYLVFNLKFKNEPEMLKSLIIYDSLVKKINDTENKVSFFNWEMQYQTAEKESKIAQQQLQLEKETNRRNLALGSVGLVLFLSFGGFIWFRNKQKNKELQNQNTLLSLQQNLNEMELSNLNKQLDPHEIKNLLASISPEIQDKAPEAYKKMIKLLNITKAGLNNNSLTEAVENQVKQIDDFLSLEKQMSSKEFEYEISNQIKDTSVKIPRLLLKNLVENSIKHGIRKKENGGKIEVQLVENDNHLYVTVDDTGIGRKFAISQDSGIGTSTYIKLFETLNKRNNKPATFEILDKEEGTRVEVRIPKEYKYE